MIGWRSLEARLTAWYSLMLFLGYVVIGLALWWIVSYSVNAAVDDLLVDRVERLVDVVASDADGPEEVEEELVDYVTGLPESHFAQIFDGEGDRVFPSDGSSADTLPLEPTGDDRVFRTVEVDERPYRVIVERVTVLGQSFTLVLASSLQSLVSVRDRIASSLLVAGPVALILCSGGGFALARRALAPVDRITEAAGRMTVGKLSSRIPVPDTGDALERLARTFNEMLERLESSVHRIEQFSADASHELRTPLSVIRTTAELALRHGRTEAEYRADLEEVHAQAEHLTELVGVLLTLSRQGIESSAILAMEDLDLAEITENVCRQFRKEFDSRGLSLKLEVSRPVVVLANQTSLFRLLSTLLENSLTHTKTGGVTVSVTPEGDVALLRVTDTGEGIPEVALGKIFDRFYRADSSRTPATGNYGLGLSIAKRIAELHEAELSVESQVGVGTTFRVGFRRRSGGST